MTIDDRAEETASDELAFNRSFEGNPGELVRLSPMVRRMIAGNSSPMTFTGTCTYVIGNGDVAVLDPGPDSARHITALLEALHGETITTILVTHTHRDHSPAAAILKAATGARLFGCAPYMPHVPQPGESMPQLDASHDLDYAPERILRDGDVVECKEFALDVVATPGHTQNHLSFALAKEGALFSGDHVMAWSTSVIVPPDGNLRDYMESLEKLRVRNDKIYWPGHGGPVTEPQRFVRAVAHHRRQREQAILSRLAAGDRAIPEIVTNVYQGLSPVLQSAASLSVLAHLEDLVMRGKVRCHGPLSLKAVFELT